MTALEVAFTVLVYGAVAAGALLTLYSAAYLDALTKKAKAQADSERAIMRPPH